MLLPLCIRSTPLTILAHSVPVKLDEASIYRALRMHQALSLTLSVLFFFFFFSQQTYMFVLANLSWQKLVQLKKKMEVRLHPSLAVFFTDPYSVLCPTLHIRIIATFNLLTAWSRIRSLTNFCCSLPLQIIGAQEHKRP